MEGRPIRPVRWRTGAAWGWLVAGLVLMGIGIVGVVNDRLGWIYLLSGVAWVAAAAGYLVMAHRRNRAPSADAGGEGTA